MTESNFYLFTILITCLTVVISAFSLYLTNKSNKSPACLSQLEKVYSPLFKFLAPSLYQKPEKETVEEFISLADSVIKNNHHLCHPELINRYNKLETALSSGQDFNKDFNAITYHIDIYHDKLCRSSYLPVRDLFFRLNKNHFYNKSHKIDYIIRLVIYALFQFFVGTLLAVAVLALLTALLQLTNKLPRGL